MGEYGPHGRCEWEADCCLAPAPGTGPAATLEASHCEAAAEAAGRGDAGRPEEAGTLRGPERGRRQGPQETLAGRGDPRGARPAKPLPSRQGGSAFYLSRTPGAAPPTARGRRARDGPGVPSGPLGRTPLRPRRPVSAAPRAAGRADPPSAPRHPEGLRLALKRRVRDVRASPGRRQGSPGHHSLCCPSGRADLPHERPPRPRPAPQEERPAPPGLVGSLSLLSPSLTHSPSPSPFLPSPPPSLSLSRAFSPRVTRAACAQPDCLSKIQNLTFEWRPGCAALAHEPFAVKTRATLAAACPGYRGAQINNTQTMKKIRKRQIKANECLEQVISLKQLWQRLSRIS
ncbi:thymic stromal lymphopoietin [Cervus elaphus]|uniref:thymic stromal lymphopoietin n=1 Tax=Cervus elaphus TaxID=9860 RepID=UPI001CC2B2EC|nr:thymic stromal lymphopoietin [Cervus elaphus]